MIHGCAHRHKQTDGDQTPSAQHKSPALLEASDRHTHKEQELLSLPEASTLHSNNWGRKKKPATDTQTEREEEFSLKKAYTINHKCHLGDKLTFFSLSLIQG